MSSSRDILFSTERFNLSIPGEHFINPCCFGEDLAAWLSQALATRGYNVSEPGQEDWGWYLELSKDESRWFLGVGGNSDEDPANPNRGEWRVIVEPKRSFFKKFSKAPDDPLVPILIELLNSEPDFSNVHEEVAP